MNASSLRQVLGSIEAGYALPLTQTLLHFLWQGCAVAMVYVLAERLLRRASANARYVAGLAALLLMGACLPVTFLLIPAAPAVPDAATPGMSNTPAPVAASAEERTGGESLAPAQPRVSLTMAAVPAASTPAASVSPQQTAAQRLTAFLVEAAPYASGLYVVGVVLMLLRVALGLWGGRRLRLGCTPVTEGVILEMIAAHARRLGMRIHPMVAYCERISVPVVVGVLRPMILLPASLALGLTPRQLEAVLAHELAHIRRLDLAANVLQRLVEAVLFFHPAVWWVSRRVSAERENACDDLVIRSHCGRLEYADALVRMGELCAALGNRNLLEQSAMAATGNGRSQFKRRVLRLLQTHEEPTVRLTTGGVLFMILLIVSTLLVPLAWRSAARAEEQPKVANAASPETSSDAPKPIAMSAEEHGRLSVTEEQRIEAALEILRNYRIAEKEADWASAIRELILIGKPAVPKLIEELDRTEKNATLRALGFVLRGIDDRRAVPALIRAIPRTLQPAGSDCGLLIQDNPELLKFMQQHDLDKQDRGEEFSYGRPIREIMFTLERMTGQKHGWKELNFVHLEGGPEQQRQQRRAFLKLAQRWVDWWAKNWQHYVEKEGDAQLHLIRQSLEHCANAVAATAGPPRSDFPTGPKIVLSGGTHDFFSRSFDESPSSGFRDLDLGSHPCPPPEMIKPSAERQPSPELLAWADREGVDLITIRFTPSGSDQPAYAFLPLGVKVWRIDNAQFDGLEELLRRGEQPDLSLPWEGPLALVDADGRSYDENLTMTFLFITREGTCGVLQLQDPISIKLVPGTPSPGKGGLLYKYIFEGEPEA